MTTVGHILQELAGTMHLWRDTAMVVLALIVIGALWLYASLVGVD